MVIVVIVVFMHLIRRIHRDDILWLMSGCEITRYKTSTKWYRLQYIITNVDGLDCVEEGYKRVHEGYPPVIRAS